MSFLFLEALNIRLEVVQLVSLNANKEFLFLFCRYGYVTPNDVAVLLDQHIAKGEIIDHLWRFVSFKFPADLFHEMFVRILCCYSDYFVVTLVALPIPEYQLQNILVMNVRKV